MGRAVERREIFICVHSHHRLVIFNLLILPPGPRALREPQAPQLPGSRDIWRADTHVRAGHAWNWPRQGALDWMTNAPLPPYTHTHPSIHPTHFGLFRADEIDRWLMFTHSAAVERLRKNPTSQSGSHMAVILSTFPSAHVPPSFTTMSRPWTTPGGWTEPEISVKPACSVLS